jgi:hypothetical protein
MIVRQAQLFLRADHAGRFHAPNRGALECLSLWRRAVAIKQLGPLDRKRHFLAPVARAQIRRASDYRLRRPVAIVHHRQGQLGQTYA